MTVRVGYYWLLRAACATLLLALAACGSSPTAISGPPTATSVASAMKNSSMKTAHCTVQGTLASGATRYPATGEGTIQIKPSYALQLNLQVQTGTILGNIGFDEIIVNGTEFTRTGTDAWTSQPDSSASSATTPNKYIGEETLTAGKAWHVQSQSASGTYDDWVRESDGYLMKIAYAGTDGSTLTMTFDSYNTGTNIVAPQGAIPASPTPTS